MRTLKHIFTTILLFSFLAVMPQSYTFSSIDKCTSNGWQQTTVNGSVNITAAQIIFTVNENEKVLFIVDKTSFITPLDNRFFCCDEDYNTIIIRVVEDNHLKQNADLLFYSNIIDEKFSKFCLTITQN